jgi:hypothetical protein
VDVSRAFDSVDIQLLLSLVEPLLRHEQYLVLKYWEVLRYFIICTAAQQAGLTCRRSADMCAAGMEMTQHTQDPSLPAVD